MSPFSGLEFLLENYQTLYKYKKKRVLVVWNIWKYAFLSIKLLFLIFKAASDVSLDFTES
jgi:hypothetical protein